MKRYNVKKLSLVLCGFVLIGTSSCGKKIDNPNKSYEIEQDKNEDSIDIEDNTNSSSNSLNNNETNENVDTIDDLIEEELNNEQIAAKEILIKKLITVIDFIFYDTEIGGLTFNQISEGTKQNIIDTFYMIDENLEYYYPGYKNELSIKYQNAIDEIKKLYSKTETKINNNLTEEEKNQINYGVEKAKEYGNVVEEKVTDSYNQNKTKVKNWYEQFRNKY